jgi:hypothetical protein
MLSCHSLIVPEGTQDACSQWFAAFGTACCISFVCSMCFGIGTTLSQHRASSLLIQWANRLVPESMGLDLLQRPHSVDDGAGLRAAPRRAVL